MLPNTNLPMNIPLVEFQPPKNFTIKDQHLLKPPQVMGTSNTRVKNKYNKFIIFIIYFR